MESTVWHALHFLSPCMFCLYVPKVWPVYRVLDDDGSVRDDAREPDLGREVALKMYGNMVRLEAMDDIFYNAQRQVLYV